ncbi:helix-turn-helix transcriptional regulator [Bythopirellula goksoeyrii]|uniref:MarR family protein n=1 Tax=Bythopirellula goksoeyrii TaxID=1400387 RepID=A0A5B9QCM8_9BACT|nr:winged helix-turn-helix transcriptional regulator [Bythopirellula goksoeyrii]QEG35559.1 MarR family protein [Bythopirellula goksoeyrii]
MPETSLQHGVDNSTNDREIIEFVRREGAASISELVEFTGVTATAVRQRLTRLMEQGLIERESEKAGRGRPTHRYSLSSAGVRTSGTNYEDLAGVLWAEIRAVKDPDVRYGLLKRIVSQLADHYRDRIQGDSIEQRMQSLVALMGERDVPFEVTQTDGSQLPVLTALACPYPTLAEQDRTVCSMEKMLFSEVLGEGLKLSSCRLDGATHCTFDTNGRSAPTL